MKFAYSRPGGGVSIVVAAPKEQLERLLGKMTHNAYEAHIRKRLIPSDVSDVIELPNDWEPPTGRELRNTWRLVGGKVVSLP